MMQTSLIRNQFIDRSMGEAEIESVACLLCDWFRQRHYGDSVTQITATLWGFARGDGDELAQSAQSAVQTQNRAHITASLSGPDFLVLRSLPFTGSGDADVREPVSAILSMLQSGLFENLWCEIGFALHLDAKDQGEGRKRFERRLTLAGIVRGNQFVLRAIWPEGDGEFDANTYANAVWPQEARFLQSLTAFQNGERSLPSWASQNFFRSTDAVASNRGMVWFLQTPRKVKPVLERLFAAAGIVGVCETGLTILRHTPQPPGVIIIFYPLLFIFSWIALFVIAYLVGNHAWMIWQARSGMRAYYQKQATQPSHHVSIHLEDAPPEIQNDPALLKFSREIENLGGIHFTDIGIEPPPAFHGFIRTYQFPNEAVWFSLILVGGSQTSRFFPAKPTFLVRTNLADGFRLVSSNSSNGYRRKLQAHVLGRRFMDVSDPGDMLQKHLAAVAKAEAKGYVRLSLEPDRILAQMDEEEREGGAASQKYGYFRWADAFRMVFDLPRREYAEDA